jgi:hypothetical protein
MSWSVFSLGSTGCLRVSHSECGRDGELIESADQFQVGKRIIAILVSLRRSRYGSGRGRRRGAKRPGEVRWRQPCTMLSRRAKGWSYDRGIERCASSRSQSPEACSWLVVPKALDNQSLIVNHSVRRPIKIGLCLAPRFGCNHSP